MSEAGTGCPGGKGTVWQHLNSLEVIVLAPLNPVPSGETPHTHLHTQLAPQHALCCHHGSISAAKGQT